MSLTNILVVDDEPMVLATLRILLESRGARVATAPNANAALVLFVADTFDLVITDYRLLGMDGAQLARRIKSTHPNLPIILLTAFAPQALTDPNTAGLFSRILEKPFGPATLFNAINDACSIKSLAA